VLTTDVPWDGVILIVSGVVLAVVGARLIRVWMDIRDAKKMQKEENLTPLLGVVSPNFDKIVELSKSEEEKKNVSTRSRKR
jgi:hypothetical protein